MSNADLMLRDCMLVFDSAGLFLCLSHRKSGVDVTETGGRSLNAGAVDLAGHLIRMPTTFPHLDLVTPRVHCVGAGVVMRIWPSRTRRGIVCTRSGSVSGNGKHDSPKGVATCPLSQRTDPHLRDG